MEMVDGYAPLVPHLDFAITALFSVHYFEYTSDFVYQGEKHDFWEFCYVDKGEIDQTVEGEVIHLKKPQIIFHKPGEFHALRANGTVAPNLVVASFTCDSPAMEWFGGRVIDVDDEERRILAAIVREAADAFLTPLNDPELKYLTRSAAAPIGAEQMITTYLEQLLIGLYRKGQDPGPAKRKPTSMIRERSQQDSLSKVVEYLEDNVDKRLTLADICRDNLVGRSYLQKIFREKTGGGAMDYFGKLKVEAAKRMIREGRHNFTEISAKLGYNSIHYFSRHFKKVTGMTPSEYASSVKVLTERSTMRDDS